MKGVRENQHSCRVFLAATFLFGSVLSMCRRDAIVPKGICVNIHQFHLYYIGHKMVASVQQVNVFPTANFLTLVLKRNYYNNIAEVM